MLAAMCRHQILRTAVAAFYKFFGIRYRIAVIPSHGIIDPAIVFLFFASLLHSLLPMLDLILFRLAVRVDR